MKKKKMQVYVTKEQFMYVVEQAEKLGLTYSGFMVNLINEDKKKHDHVKYLNNDPYFI